MRPTYMCVAASSTRTHAAKKDGPANDPAEAWPSRGLAARNDRSTRVGVKRCPPFGAPNRGESKLSDVC